MTTQTALATDVRFRIGWWVMVGLAAASAIGHLALMAVADEPVLFLGWALFNLLVLAVLVVPFRRGEPWAWSSSWLLALGYVSLIAFDSEVATSYVIAGAIFAACLLLTRGAFTR